jgi:hypothetical protein
MTEKTRILFIGNSFTARNDLPGLLAKLAAQKDRVIEHELVSRGGASLRQHWNAGTAAKALEKGWDFVVLQEQSTLPLKNEARFHDNVRTFVGPIQDVGARMLLYMTWARRDAGEAAAKALARAYDAIGREVEATVVPVGRAWQRLLTEDKPPLLHDKDGSHPTPLGTYLAACVFHTTLFGKLPPALDIVDPEHAKRVHAVADALFETEHPVDGLGAE